MNIITRRSILRGLFAAPVVVAAANLMPLRGIVMQVRQSVMVMTTASALGDPIISLGETFQQHGGGVYPAFIPQDVAAGHHVSVGDILVQCPDGTVRAAAHGVEGRFVGVAVDDASMRQACNIAFGGTPNLRRLPPRQDYVDELAALNERLGAWKHPQYPLEKIYAQA